MQFRSLRAGITAGLTTSLAAIVANAKQGAPIVQAVDSNAEMPRTSIAAVAPPNYDMASAPFTHPPQPDGRHEIRFTLLGCPPRVRPKISGTSRSGEGEFTPSPPGSIIVPADFMGSVYLTSEGCGKYGNNCQSIDLTFMPKPNATVRSYINFDAMGGKKVLFPVKARFDDNKDTSEAASIDCASYDCVDASRDPDDFITNRIYSSTYGVGVDIVYDCRSNATSMAD